MTAIGYLIILFALAILFDTSGGEHGDESYFSVFISSGFIIFISLIATQWIIFYWLLKVFLHLNFFSNLKWFYVLFSSIVAMYFPSLLIILITKGNDYVLSLVSDVYIYIPYLFFLFSLATFYKSTNEEIKSNNL